MRESTAVTMCRLPDDKWAIKITHTTKKLFHPTKETVEWVSSPGVLKTPFGRLYVNTTSSKEDRMEYDTYEAARKVYHLIGLARDAY